ncbi:hypothetical protein GCM10007049_12300 [Echinicola pacifica]|uniref:Carbohydrate-binding domain-containing protein n=1 Tax=Echinicola pacifica TaxID=346377 RepID=A0A918UMH1_9BACT|nr:carbohydrate-binding family 9-like protein [Echinicola pacifica]GGZ21200.1 hypothetical protein GCM10007049_12300 [Echinicola pacifica]
MKYSLLLAFCFIISASYGQALEDRQHYVAFRTDVDLEMDGFLDEADWEKAEWSNLFVDIEGDKKPAPLQDTRLKMLWDDENLYIGVWMEESDLWATYTERESVIFHENDIEVFIDPDGDTHNYYELEINALGTEWDLMLTKPYRNLGSPINGWNINGFEKGIQLFGTLNDPSDRDSCWTVEMAIPWKALSQSGPSFAIPKDGQQWRINFSRVQWQLAVEDGKYIKKINPATGKSFPEYNWVWSAQGHINMHLPEYWGYLQFADQPVGGNQEYTPDPDSPIQEALRELYGLQAEYLAAKGHYATSLKELPGGSKYKKWNPSFEVSQTRFKMAIDSSQPDKKWYITEDSRIWRK